MSFDPTPWMIAGGAQHTADLARVLAFAATNGEEGVVLPESWRVSPLGTPGGKVVIGPGAGLLVNPLAGYTDQTYVGRSGTDTQLDVPAAGAGGRNDLVVVRVEDPQFPPWQAPANPAIATYLRPFLVQNVPPGTTSARALNLGYPALALARIDIPANTAAITGAMINDVRQVASPRSRRQLLIHHPSAKNGMGPGTTPGGRDWPVHFWQVDVPLWATRAVISGTIAGAKVGHPDPAVNGDIDTTHAIIMGTAQDNSETTPSATEWLTVVSPVTGQRGYMRGDIQTGGTLDVSRFRGQRIDVRFRGSIVAGNGELYVDQFSKVIIDLEFQERAV